MRTPYVEAFMKLVPELCADDVDICAYQMRSSQ